MALQSSFYNTDGSTRTFPSTKHIATKQHVSVYQKRIADNVWVLVAVEDFSLINNSVVFDTAPDIAIYSQIEVRVADTANELVNSPSDIALVAGSIANVNTVATNITAVNTTATNIASVQTVSGSIANVNTTAGSIANVNTVAPDIANVNTVAGSIADVNSVATTVVPNIAEILLADNNATTATTQAGIATTQAGLATGSATEAEHWANYTVDVAVPEGTGEFSAKHYATKAQQALAGLTVDATPTDGSSNAVSSNGVFDSLATKQATLVSGTNIKTVNGVNILGSGNATVADSTKLPLAGGTMTGAITALRETKVAMGTSTIDLSLGNVFTRTPLSSPTFTVTNWLPAPASNSFILELTNGGAFTVVWPAGTKWAGGIAPTLTASGVDILGFYSHDGGTTVRGIVLSKDSK